MQPKIKKFHINYQYTLTEHPVNSNIQFITIPAFCHTTQKLKSLWIFFNLIRCGKILFFKSWLLRLLNSRLVLLKTLVSNLNNNYV